MNQGLRRIVLVGRDMELRVVSLVMRGREVAEEVVLFDTGSNDETVELAAEVDCPVFHYASGDTPQDLCAHLQSIGLDDGLTLFLPIASTWKLAELPLSVNRAREGWDVHFLYRTASSTDASTPEEVVLADTEPCHLIVSPAGCASVAGLEKGATMDLIGQGLRVRLVKAEQPISLPQRQSLATASRFAQLFYWMLESKHPLLLFGVPGVVLFVLGYRLSGDLATMFTELNSTSIGVTLATIAMTLIGLFAMMVALILYIMGKQVERVQHQYNWPKGNGR